MEAGFINCARQWQPTWEANELPLTLALSPYEGERESVSLVLKQSCGFGFRSWTL
jgi:hypothetical protein